MSETTSTYAAAAPLVAVPAEAPEGIRVLTAEERRIIKQLARAATPGPWDARTAYEDYDPDAGYSEYPVVVEGPGWYVPASHASPADCEPGEYHEADGGPGPFICTTGHCPDENAPDADVPNAKANAAYIAAVSPDIALGTLAYVEHLEAAAMYNSLDAEQWQLRAEAAERDAAALTARLQEAEAAGLRLMRERNEARAKLAQEGEQEAELLKRDEELRKLRAAIRWIPIAEDLPEIRSESGHSYAVQAYCGDHVSVWPAYYIETGFYQLGTPHRMDNVTHWRHFASEFDPKTDAAAPVVGEGSQKGGADA